MKDTFFKSTIVLLVGGALTKLLGLIIKIVMTRIVGLDGISLYMLVFPTFALFMTLSQLGLPTALSKLIAENKRNNRNLILSIIPVILIFNLVLMIIIFLIANILSSFLNEPRAIIPIISIAFVLPFDSLSAILRGYFFGKERMIPHIISLIVEQVVRLLLIIFIIPNLLNRNLILGVSGLILVNIFSELASTIVLLLFIKEKSIRKEDLILRKDNIRSIIEIAIPTTASRIIGSIAYFLEPIILTSVLLFNYSNSYIVREYGIIEGYVLPLLFIPNFFTTAMSNALIPDISKKYVNKEYEKIRFRLKKVLKISIIIGTITSIILIINPIIFLNLLYKTNHGINYIKVLAPFFILLYAQMPLECSLQAINKSKNVMINNIIGTIVKLISIYIFGLLKIGLYNLIIAIILNIMITTFLHYRAIKKELY